MSVVAQECALVANIRARLQRSAARSQAIADRKSQRATKRATPPSVAFERSPEWIAMSRKARGLQPWCTKCRSTSQLQADHIKPKSKYPELALDPANIQVLCWPCNKAKGAKE